MGAGNTIILAWDDGGGGSADGGAKPAMAKGSLNVYLLMDIARSCAPHSKYCAMGIMVDLVDKMLLFVKQLVTRRTRKL